MAAGTENFVLKDYALPWGQELSNWNTRLQQEAVQKKQQEQKTALQKMKEEQAKQKASAGYVKEAQKKSSDLSKNLSGFYDFDVQGQKGAMKYLEEMQSPEIANDPIKREEKKKEFEQYLLQLQNAKVYYKEAQKQLEEINRSAPNIPQVDAKDFMNHFFMEDFFENDEKGGLRLKPTPTPRNYGNMIMSPDVLSFMNVSQEPLIKKAQANASILSESDFQNVKGYVKGKKFTIATTPFTQTTFDAKGEPIVDIKHEVLPGVKNEKGEPIKIATEDVVKEVANSDVSVRMSLASQWGQKKRELESSLNRKLTPAEEDYRSREFLYQFLKEHSPQGKRIETKTAIPKPTASSRGKGGAGAGASGEVVFRDVVGDIPTGITEGKNLPEPVIKAALGAVFGGRYPNLKGYISQDNIKTERITQPDGKPRKTDKINILLLNPLEPSKGYQSIGMQTATDIRLATAGNKGQKPTQQILKTEAEEKKRLELEKKNKPKPKLFTPFKM